jgi:hypothetical protein
MRGECVKAVATAIGRQLKAAELADIEQRVAKAMRTMARTDPEGWLAKSRADRLLEAGQLAAEEIVGEANLKRQRVALQAAAVSRVGSAIEDMKARGVDGLDALDRVIAFHADGKANDLSVETQSRAIAARALGQMLDTLTASNPKWFGLFENKEGIRALVQEIFGEESGVAEAKAGAKLWHQVAEGLRQRFNRAGGAIGKLVDWGMPHHHSQIKVAKAGVDAWVADILPRLDRSAYVNEDGTPMGDAQLNGFLREAWKSIATGGANKMEPGQAKGAGMRANRGSEERAIHFKDADSYIDYQQKFGERTPYEVLVRHIEGIAKDIALVETLGPNPDHAFRLFRDTAVKTGKEADATRSGKIDNAAINTENLYNVVAGRTLPIASKRLAETFDTLRAWLGAAKLGSAVITSFSDDATLHLTAHINDLPEMQLIRNELAALNPTNKMEERLANRAGLALNTLISSLNRFGEDGLGTSFARKLSTTVLRASGLQAITEARRRAFGVTAMHAIGATVREHPTLTALDAADKRLLKSRGITDSDFKVWKAAQLEEWGSGNDTMLTPDSIYRVSDEALAKIDPTASPTELRERAATRLLGIVLEETDVAVIEPGAKERAFMGAGMQRGTLKGELVRSFFQFKSFPLAMIAKHWDRGMSMPNRGGRAAYLGTLMAATTVLGALSLQVNEVLAGRDPRNMDVTEGWQGIRTWIAAMLKGGSLGIYGDFLFSDSPGGTRNAVADVMGPVASTVNDLERLTRGNAFEAAAGKDTHAGAEALKFVKGNLPGANLWYAKAVLDHLIFHNLQEYFSPGYLRKMRQRAQTEYGQDYYWQPGDAVPERAPDLGAIAGE